jgi:hypothetical protein
VGQEVHEKLRSGHAVRVRFELIQLALVAPDSCLWEPAVFRTSFAGNWRAIFREKYFDLLRNRLLIMISNFEISCAMLRPPVVETSLKVSEEPVTGNSRIRAVSQCLSQFDQ